MIVAFVLGILIAGVGTATAARLITGKDIKNGTISAKDLSKSVRAQLKKVGAQGPKGDPGPKGDTGAMGSASADLSVNATLPASQTLTGIYGAYGGASGSNLADTVSFRIPLSAALDQNHVHVIPKPDLPPRSARERAKPPPGTSVSTRPDTSASPLDRLFSTRRTIPPVPMREASPSLAPEAPVAVSLSERGL
jgi:hypothetical protein